jgi:hypothetical protein
MIPIIHSLTADVYKKTFAGRPARVGTKYRTQIRWGKNDNLIQWHHFLLDVNSQAESFRNTILVCETFLKFARGEDGGSKLESLG